MIRAICYYTNQEEDEPSSLRKQQHQCLEAVHDYGWVIHREVFDPFMKKVKIAQRSGMRTLLHEAAAHKFDLLVMMDKHFIGTCKEEAAVILMFLFEKGIGVFIVEDNRLYLPKQMDLASFVIKSVSELNQDGQQEESHD